MLYISIIFFIIAISTFAYLYLKTKNKLKREIKNFYSILDKLPFFIAIHNMEDIYYLSPGVEKVIGKKINKVSEYLDLFSKGEKVKILQVLSNEKEGFFQNTIREIMGKIYYITSSKINFFDTEFVLEVFKDITELSNKNKELEEMQRSIEVLDNIRNLTYTKNFNLSGTMESMFNYLRKISLIDIFAYNTLLEDKRSAKVTIYYENKKIEKKLDKSEKTLAWYFFDNNLDKLYVPEAFSFSKDGYKSSIDSYEFDENLNELTLYIFPYYFENKIHGLFAFGKKGKDAYSEKDKKILESIASHIDFVIKYQYILKKYNEEKNHFKELATKDALTQLYSRYYFNEWILKHAEYLKRKNKVSILVMIDIDKFKHINDTYGHVVGDEVLKFISNRFLENIRSMDIGVRFGGDEFLLVFPEASIDDIAKKMEIISEELKNNPFDFEISISYGISEFNGENYIKALKKADEEMYKMKNMKNGNNN
ncbi:sensor domain-containing diguanylate cyclase [Marinitoga aeolica]|uniref:GGDEF domain-containing protein n=1 Tax=Marinitoga aeolica TaxID=2809031 RepID=A0ABY8PNX7_9BACT|nr:sensor domain-containing diguanylate cyclase [Marinitoga aeolica]WGS64336.1 GGDEF domain-containing protein [Marinitoga aeolica]